MSHAHDDNQKITFKFRWLTPLLGILTLTGTVLLIMKKPYKWDQAADAVVVLTAKSADHDIILATIVSQLKDIKDDVREIKRAVK